MDREQNMQMPEKQMPEQAPQPTQPSELEVRARNEMAMLQKTAQKKQAIAQMKPKIDEDVVRKAQEILRKYKEGKARLEQKIIANEEFWKLRQWNYMNEAKKDFQPATAWLWSCIQSRYSDAMTIILPVIFSQGRVMTRQRLLSCRLLFPLFLSRTDMRMCIQTLYGTR